MNEKTLIILTAENTGQTKEQTKTTLRIAFDIIRGTVARGEPVRLPDFGTFEARNLNETNPQAGDPIDAVRVVKFFPSEAFRKEVNHRL